jgi:hypothetical protein
VGFFAKQKGRKGGKISRTLMKASFANATHKFTLPNQDLDAHLTPQSAFSGGATPQSPLATAPLVGEPSYSLIKKVIAIFIQSGIEVIF